MAVLVSPGVLTQEIDLSLYVPALTSTTLGLVGTCTKGLTNTPQLVTDATQLAQLYGNSDPNHPAILTAQWFLKFGRQLQFVRVAGPSLAASTVDLAGAATPGELVGTEVGPFDIAARTAGSHTGNELGPFDITAATNDALTITVNGGSAQPFTLTAGLGRTAQQIVDDINGATTGLTASVVDGFIKITSNTTGSSSSIQIGTPVSHSANATLGLTTGTYSGANGTQALTLNIDASGNQNITLTPGAARTAHQVAADINSQISGATARVDLDGHVIVDSNTTGTSSSVQGVSSTSLTVLGFDTTLHSGTASAGVSMTVTAATAGTWGDGLTVTITDATSPTLVGAKNLTIQLNGFTVEVWKNLTKGTSDPTYWETVINGNSSYITVADHTGVADQPGNVNKTALSGGNDGFSDVADSDFIGVVGDGYTTGLQCLVDPQNIDINLVAIPGQTSQDIHSALLSFVEARGDSMGFLDPPSGLTPTEVVALKTATGAYSSRVALNDNRAAMYYPWVNGFDAANGINVLLPPSAAAIRACAFNDSVGNVWNEFLGVNRGLVPEATGIERRLTQGEKDYVYENGINPIMSLQQYGITIMGGKTLQVAPTALDRVNVRRMLNYLHKVVVTALFPLIGEPNTPNLWRRLTALLQPTLDYMASQQGITQYQIVCDASTNPQNLVNAHEVHAKIGILPTPGAEFIYCDFVLVPNLATFNDYLAPQG